MDAGSIIGFVIWCIAGGIFIGIGISSFCAKEPVGFWANVKMCEVNDTSNYNKAMGKLYCIFGIVFIILGLPLLLAGQNSPLVFLSVAGCMALIISVMLIYELVIMKKYRKRQ